MLINVTIPENTDRIFRELIQGNYLCANHPDEALNSLYHTCEEYEDDLYKYFKGMKYELVKEEGFFYFVDLNEDNSESTTVEKKLEKYVGLINFYFVLLNIYPDINTGSFFTLAEIEQTVINSISLRNKYRAKTEETIRKAIGNDVKKFVEHGYLYPISASEGRYVILTSFARLLDFLSIINSESFEEIEEEMKKETEITEEEEGE